MAQAEHNQTPTMRAASGAPPLARTTWPTLDHVWLAAAIALLALRPLLTTILPNDFWWHMATGRLIMAQGSIPVVDQFSFTRAGEPFFNQSWLAQLLMYGLYRAGGLPLLLITQALVIVLAYGLLLRVCVLRTGRLRLSVGVLLLTLPMVFDNWTIRPQSYVLPIFAAFLALLTDWRAGRSNRLWLLPPLMALWVNMHGTFVLGLALIGLFWLGGLLQRRWPAGDEPAAALPRLGALLLWGALAAAATLINPRGIAVLGYVRGLLGSNTVTKLVTEWAPPTIHNTSDAAFFGVVLACIAVLAWGRKRPAPADMLLLLPFLWLAFGASRNILWFGMLAVPILAVQLAAVIPAPSARRSAGSPRMNGILIGMLALLVVLALPWFKPALFPPSVGALLAPQTPVAAVEALRAVEPRPQRLFHTEATGSYLIWAAPEQSVFIDPRIELYPYEQWLDYIALGQGQHVDSLLQTYQIDGLLLTKATQAPLIAAARANPAWTLRYEDENTVLFVLAAGR